MISTPYNFVPLNKVVVRPEWKECFLSYEQEKLFSGKLTFQLKAHTPIFICDSERVENGVLDFFNIEGQQMIPGSSLRGMFRSVCEILTYAALKQVNDYQFSFRSFSSEGDGKLYREKFVKIQDQIQNGWLFIDGNGYWVLPAGLTKHNRILFNDITGASVRDFNGRKTAIDIYKKILRSDGYPFEQEGSPIKQSGGNKLLVVTGNTGAGGKAQKKYQYLFTPYDQLEENMAIPVEEKVIKNFLLTVRDKEKDVSAEWSFWKEHLSEGRKIPIFFFSEEEELDGEKHEVIRHFGLTKTYKLPYDKSVMDALPQAHKSNVPDLTDYIFGYVNKTDRTALRGRVRFSHALADQRVQPLPFRELILGKPKASYYPYYIKQKELENNTGHTGQLLTWENEDIEIAGRKVYPKHNFFNQKLPQFPQRRNEKVLTKIKPLPTGSTFTGSFRFNNLNYIELGALLSSITLHSNNKTHYFNIGMAKPFGYGKIELDITQVSGISMKDVDQSMGIFQNFMEKQVGSQWFDNALEFLALCSADPLKENYGDTTPEFRYPKIKNENGINEFEKTIKDQKRMLPPFSNLIDDKNPRNLPEAMDYQDYLPVKLIDEKQLLEAIEKLKENQ